MNLIMLKSICKENGMIQYNNLKKDELIENIKKYDEDIKKEEKRKEQIILSGITIISRKEDGYINATQLCKLTSKKYNDWFRLDKTKDFLTELEKSINSERGGNPATELIKSKQGGIPEEQGTWVHPYVAINIAQWCSNEFSVKC